MRRIKLFILVLLLVTFGCTHEKPAHEPGQWAPDFRAEDLTGLTYFLNAQLKHPVLLVFFATWCAPCREEIPSLIRLHEQHKDRLTILTVVVDPVNVDKIRAMAKGLSIPYPLLLDREQKIMTAYRVSRLPDTFLIGTDGRILSRFRGFGPQEERTIIETIQRIKGSGP